MNRRTTRIYSIGHSTQPVDRFIKTLKSVGISAIADVRSTPYSRHQPQFNRESLKQALNEDGIRYAFLGEELGGRGVGPSVRDHHGQVQYGLIAKSDLFHSGIERLHEGSKRMRIAIMCTEGEPLNCHRTILISRHLAKEGFEVVHIHPGGGLESHHDAETRLLNITGLHEPEMFRAEDEILDEAYRRQEARVAYVAPLVKAEEKAPI